jgi:hypothetical protein
MFYGLCFLALYILFNAYMCFLSFFELHQLQLSCTAPALYGLPLKGFIDVLQLVCALEPIQGPRRSGGSLEPGACRRCSSRKKKIPVTAVSTYILYRIYCDP